ncbi:MAG: HAD hydrolase family protein [Stecheria intestinalis]|nr:HAD hydrolase family protein [Stecheria intestinalis]
MIAFGDAGNDRPMLEKAGIGVAMGNAKDDVKSAADLVADTCVNDGVAKVLEEMKLA